MNKKSRTIASSVHITIQSLQNNHETFNFFYSGANPNAQTTETEEMKVKATERARARETAKKQARQKAREKFVEMETAKALEKAKEAERQKKSQKLPSSQLKSVPAVPSISANKLNSFEQDLGHSTNPFDESDQFSFGSEDATNPFLDDIRAASAAASALSYGGNPFDEPPEGTTSRSSFAVDTSVERKTFRSRVHVDFLGLCSSVSERTTT